VNAIANDTVAILFNRVVYHSDNDGE